MSEQQSGRTFGDVRFGGIEDDEPHKDTSPVTPVRAQVKRPARVSVNMPAEVYEDLRAAQFADLIDLGDQAPITLDKWVQAAIEDWSRLTPARRESREVRREGSGTIRSYVMTDIVWDRLDTARGADLERRGPIGRSTFALEAVQYAIEQTRSRRGGGELPRRPLRRSTKKASTM